MSEIDPTYKPMPKGMHFKSALGKIFLGAWDCAEDRTLTITKAELAQLPGVPGRIKGGQKPVLSFKGTDKKLIVNVTIGTTIAGIVKSSKPSEWVGHRITLYAAWDRGGGGGQVECVRVRPKAPTGPDTGVPVLPVDEAMIARQSVAAGEELSREEEPIDPDDGP
jgi:hypothetical protein